MCLNSTELNRRESKRMTFFKSIIIHLFLIILINALNEDQVPNHTNNWAIIVDTSRFWFNYRHAANVLSIYRSVKRLGIPDRYFLSPRGQKYKYFQI